MRSQRLIIPVLFALLLVLAYVVAAQTDENLPDPYQGPTLATLEPGALVVDAAQTSILPVTATPAVCEVP